MHSFSTKMEDIAEKQESICIPCHKTFTSLFTLQLSDLLTRF